MRQIFNRILIAFAGLSMLSIAPARAYEEDTHFTLTLVMCRAVGLTQEEALIVATYDQGMDDSKGTLANDGASPNEVEEHVWHAIPLRGTKEEVLNRKEELWNLVLAEKDATKRLQRLGVFFHYQQDTWAHRKHPNSSQGTFTPYSVPFGHVKDGHQPDRPPFDPVCALRCLEEGVDYATRYMSLCLHRSPSKLFRLYGPADGKVDDSWERKGEAFNTLKIDDSTRGRRFLTHLIRSLIDAYSSSFDVRYFAQTANEAEYEDVRIRLQAVCDQAKLDIKKARLDIKLDIIIPKKRIPITTLTTAQLLK